MPDPGGSANTWGNTLNQTLGAIDTAVLSVEQNSCPIGSVTMFAGPTPPTNWMICDGSPLSRTTYLALFTVIGTAFNPAATGDTFNLPNLTQKFPLGAGPNIVGSSAGTFSYTIAAINLPAHTHPITQVAHTHTATQPAHVHFDPGHTHTASEAAHTHTIAGSFGNGIGGVAPPNPLVNQGGSTTTSSAQPAITVNAAFTGLQAAGADAITVSSTTPTGPTATGNNTGGTPLSIVPPFTAINFIIKVQ